PTGGLDPERVQELRRVELEQRQPPGTPEVKAQRVRELLDEGAVHEALGLQRRRAVLCAVSPRAQGLVVRPGKDVEHAPGLHGSPWPRMRSAPPAATRPRARAAWERASSAARPSAPRSSVRALT